MRRVAQYRLEGIANFRDFGGVACRGGHLAAGRLFRSGHLAAATPDDVAALDALGIATIIDLRRPGERRKDKTPSALAGRVVTGDEDDQAEAPHLEFLRGDDTSDAAVERFLLDYYRRAPFEPRLMALFARAFAALEAGPVLIHCTAGKDRTGILAALILLAADVHPDDVMADFLATNAAMLTPANMERAAAQARRLLGREPGPAIVRALLGVEAQYLAAALDAIRARAGSLAAYLARLEPPPAQG